MNPSEKYTDHEVAQQVLDGNKALYEIIVRRYNAPLYKIGRSYNFNHDDTQDLMQQTFIEAYKSLAQFEGRSSFRTWISRIMLNQCYHKQAKLSFKNETMQDMNDNARPLYTATTNDTDRSITTRELGHILETALLRIPQDYRMTFSLREINGMSVAETASLLNISEANVKVRHNRAKAMLRTEIEKHYSPEDLFEFNLIYCNAMVAQVMKIINEL